MLQTRCLSCTGGNNRDVFEANVLGNKSREEDSIMRRRDSAFKRSRLTTCLTKPGPIQVLALFVRVQTRWSPGAAVFTASLPAEMSVTCC